MLAAVLALRLLLALAGAPSSATAAGGPPLAQAPSAVHTAPLGDRYEIYLVGGIGHRNAPPTVTMAGGTTTVSTDLLNVVELGAGGRWLMSDDPTRTRWGLAGGFDTNQFADVRVAAGGALSIPLTVPTLIYDANQRVVLELEATLAAGRPRGVTQRLRAGVRARVSYGLFVTQDAPNLLAEFGGYLEARDDTAGEVAFVGGIELSYWPESL